MVIYHEMKKERVRVVNWRANPSIQNDEGLLYFAVAPSQGIACWDAAGNQFKSTKSKKTTPSDCSGPLGPLTIWVGYEEFFFESLLFLLSVPFIPRGVGWCCHGKEMSSVLPSIRRHSLPALRVSPKTRHMLWRPTHLPSPFATWRICKSLKGSLWCRSKNPFIVNVTHARRPHWAIENHSFVSCAESFGKSN